MPLPAFIEGFLGYYVLYNKRDRKDLFETAPAFADHPKPTIEITSPDCGPSGSAMTADYSQVGSSRFPHLTWSKPSFPVKEYVLISEDPDAPLAHPIVHGLYYFIPGTTTEVTNEDVRWTDAPAGTQPEERELKSGWGFGMGRHAADYTGPRPVLGHGPHRYHFTLIALSEGLDPRLRSGMATKELLQNAVKGKVAAWGQWVGSYERKWE